MLLSFMAITSIFRLFGIFYGHLVYFLPFWYILPVFGMLYQEKSGNPSLPDQIGRIFGKQNPDEIYRPAPVVKKQSISAVEHPQKQS
jgi:hypothetical protein